jgi:RHS repeat-associated protein
MNFAAGTRATFIPDIQGSIVGTLDASSGTLTKRGYLPYGGSISVTGSFAFTGQRIDPETNGLYYYSSRHYMPAWGRFMQPDQIGYRGGVNLFAYVDNDPLNRVDPLGLCDDPQACGGGGTSGGNVQVAQAAMGLCVLGPAGCAAGAGITAGQILLGGAAVLGAGAIILNSESNQPPQPGTQAEPQSPEDILMPGGAPIGAPNGSDETTRNVPGGQTAAEGLYGQLSNGGTPANSGSYPGQAVTLPGGGFVGLRPGSASKSGVPAVDVNIPGIPIGKVHFPQ